MQAIENLKQLEELTAAHPITALYFSGQSCGVCHALRPKIESLFGEEFPHVPLVEIAIEQQPKIAAQYSVFTLPVLIVYIDGHEGPRFARSFSLDAIRESLERPYNLIFE